LIKFLKNTCAAVNAIATPNALETAGFELPLKPRRMQLRVQPALRQKLGVRALLDNATLIEHDNLIGVFDGAESMPRYQSP
jgi:hypothetical protein